MITALSIAWALLVALPFVGLIRRVAAAERALELSPSRARRRRAAAMLRRARGRVVRNAPLRTIDRVLRSPMRSRSRRRLDDEMARQVAVAVDLVGLGVAAGYTPYLAVELGAQWSPPLVGREFAAAVRACALGRSFDDALRELGRRTPAARAFTDALRTSARLGSPAAPALTRLASELRADLRRRAEARARTVPVRLCFPLVGCILPAFALLTVVPAVVAGIVR
ncbi:MAG TPA: type II secretion system F family protein [Acidimicrobiia bacterium]|nr:type II secretion system F family protein [Acidimicrobiia bacterium]